MPEKKLLHGATKLELIFFVINFSNRKFKSKVELKKSYIQNSNEILIVLRSKFGKKKPTTTLSSEIKFLINSTLKRFLLNTKKINNYL